MIRPNDKLLVLPNSEMHVGGRVIIIILISQVMPFPSLNRMGFKSCVAGAVAARCPSRTKYHHLDASDSFTLVVASGFIFL